MEKKRTKKDVYNESPIDLRTYINGETAIKPYWYLRNGLLHVRYTVDRCVELSENEVQSIKEQLNENVANKQEVLEKNWKLMTDCVGKAVIHDGIAEIEKRIEESKRYDRH